MKKWLVGLLAAGLCAASAWAETVTYTVANKAVTVTEGTAPVGSSAAYSQTYGTSGQATANNSMTLTLTGYEGVTITGLTLSMHSNAGRGAGSLVATSGETEFARIDDGPFSDDSWHGEFTSSFVPVTPAVAATTVGDEEVSIVIAASVNSLYVESYTIEYTTEPLEFSISLDPAENFEVVKGEEAAIMAVPQYPAGAVTYVWGADGVPGTVEGNVFTIDSSEIGGPYTVTCDANDGTSNAAQQTVSFSIVAAPAVYDVEVVQSAGGIVSVEPASGIAGTEIAVTAEPDDGYRLVEILVDGDALDGNTFTLPEGGATVSATFELSLERTAVYTVASKTEVTESGDVPDGSSATYEQVAGSNAGQITGVGTFKLTLKGYEGATITGLTLSMKSNGKSGAGRLDVTCGDAIIAAIEDAQFSSSIWNGMFSTTYVDIVPYVTPTMVDDDVVVLITGSENSLYCQSVSVTYEVGGGMFSVALDPAEDFEVIEGAEATVTAEAKNALGEVTYAWTVDGVAVNEAGNVLALDTDTVGGPHEVVCVATDGGAEGATAEAGVKYTVTAAPQAYTVTVDAGIENGTVDILVDGTRLESPAEVLEGTAVTVVATPATRSYKVESVVATRESGGEIALVDGVFEMPAENVTVAATFVERTGDLYEQITTSAELEDGDYVITGLGSDGNEYAMLNEASTTTSSDYVKRQDDPVDAENDAISGPDDSIVWTLAATDGGWTIYNAAAGYVCYVPNMGNSANVEAEASARSTWTIEANDDGLFTVANVGDSTRVLRYNPSNPRFACYDKPASGTSLAFYKKSGSGTFSITLDPAEDFEVPEGEGATVTATPKNAQGEVSYTWNVTEGGTPGSAEGNVWTIPADAPAGGPWTLYCTANDGTTETDASVSFSIVAAPVIYEVTVDEGIEHGDVSVDPASGVAGTVIAVTAIPHEGYRCDGIYVNGDPIVGNTFELPEGGATVGAVFVESNTKTATYTVVSKTEVETTSEAPAGSTATFECNGYSETQLTGGSHMTLTLKGYNGATLTGLILSMKSNARGGAGSLRVTCGDALIAAVDDSRFNTESWYGGWSTSYVPITPAVTPTVVDGDVVITIAASANSLFCESFTIEYEPAAAVFSVGFDKEDGFTVPLGESSGITASAENGIEPYGYAWSSETPELNGSGPELEIPGTLEPGAYTVTVTATDSSDEPQTATADISFEVLAPPADYTVTVAGGIENGTVELSVGGEPLVTPAELQEGTEVTVVATPADGFELDAITVNGEAIEGSTFTVAGDSEVSATFAAVKDYATLPFLADNTPFTGPWQSPKAAGVTAEGLGTDYNNETDGRGARFDTEGAWLQIKFEGTPDELSYALKGNGTSGDYAFNVLESATGAEDAWTIVASYPANGELKQGKTGFTNELSANSRFVRFVYATKAAGNVALYDVYISSGGFSVSLDKEDGFEVVQGTADAITATAKNGEAEPYEYEWTSETPALNGYGATLAIPDTLEPGDYTVTVTAYDYGGDVQTATATVSFTVVEPPPTFTVDFADGILNGTIAIFVDGAEVEMPAQLAAGTEVTVVATPVAGYKTGEISVNDTVLSGDSFTVTEDATIYASFVERGDEFVKITTLEELEEGEYVITCAGTGGEYAMLAELSDGSTVFVKRQEEAVEIENGNTIAGPDASIVWTVAKVADGWTIHNEAIGYVGYVASGNSAGAEAEASEKSTWTIAESGGLFLLTNVGNTGRYLLYNVSNPRFACYTSPSSGKALAFYKKAGPAVFGVSVSDTEFELKQGEQATVTASAKNGAEPYSYVWTSDTPELNGTGGELAIPDTLEAGEYAATVTVTDSSEPPQTDTATVEFTVVAPLPVFAITVAEGIENGTVEVDKAEAEQGETVTVTATPAENYKLVAILVNGEPIEGNTFEAAGNSVVSATFAPIVKYPVTIDETIEHGTVEADKAEAEAGETVTLTAEADEDWKLGWYLVNDEKIEGNTFEMLEGGAQVSAVFVERVKETYVPVESEADFAVGEEYLLVAVKEDVYASAMKNAANGTRIGVDEVEIAEDGSITTDNADIVWTIQAGAEEGQYVLFSGAGGVYAAGPASAGNNAQLVADGTDALAQWTLDFSALPEVKIASVSYKGRWLQRNGDKNNAYFATYSSAQVHPLLYKKAGPAVFSITLDPADEYFEVEQGSEAFLTATPHNEEGVVGYEWIVEGDVSETTGNVLTLDTSAVGGPYKVTCIATDGAGEKAYANAIYSVITAAVKYQVAIDETIENGEVIVDKALAAEDETVTVTATPAAGYELVAITVDGEPIEGDTFEMPAKDVLVSAVFAEVMDYVTLPFLDKETPYPGPWKNPEVAGLTNEGLDSDYKDGSAKFDSTGAWMQIKFRGTPGTLSFGIKGNGTSATNVSTFAVRESADGETWTDVAVFTTDDNLTTSRQDVSFTLSEDSRYVQFLYREKGDGNVGIYDVYIGEAGDADPAVTVTGETTLTLGGTFALELALENYSRTCTWAWAPATIGYVEPDTATFWWEPTKAGETEVTFSAMDGDRTVASETVTLTVLGAPALVFCGDDEGTVGTPVNFTVAAENVADPTVTFLGFLEVPEGSALTDDDVALDFPNVSFTPDVAGEYGLAFSAGTAGVDYIDDVLVVTVTGEEPPPAEAPRITKIKIDTAGRRVTLWFTSDGTEVWGTDEITKIDSWEKVDAEFEDNPEEGKKALVEMDKHFLCIQ